MGLLELRGVAEWDLGAPERDLAAAEAAGGSAGWDVTAGVWGLVGLPGEQ